MERQSYCLAIRRIQGTCDYDVLARLIESIHEEKALLAAMTNFRIGQGQFAPFCFLPVTEALDVKENAHDIYSLLTYRRVNESIYGIDDTAIASLSGTDSPQKKKNSTELNALDRYINDGYGFLEDLNRYPTIKEIFI
ncbi:hypothetical protein OUZ56_024223 [Daphnia magna]|uniref:Uncharacterized protein n=1 Tax=Daphnia magna TaxID=35525 RepID=A0ABR0B0D0_9CRUS|nr:hypothetical protein OUZ56_024223 [Daphnia magna]